MRPAIILDRDGTLIEEVDYLSRVEQIRLLPGVPGALRALRGAGYALVLVTNQSGVARGLFSEEELGRIHEALVARLQAHGVALDGLYHCPHHPDHGLPPYRAACRCRKPATGLLERAVEALGLDLGRSWAVGDKLTDLEGVLTFGGRAILVRTGHGAREEGRPRRPEILVADDLPAATRRILAAPSP